MENKVDEEFWGYKLITVQGGQGRSIEKVIFESRLKIGKEWATQIGKMSILQALEIVFAKNQRQECAWHV